MNLKHHSQSHLTMSIILIVAFIATVSTFLYQVCPLNWSNMRSHPGPYLMYGFQFLFNAGILMMLWRLRNHESPRDVLTKVAKRSV